MSWPRFEPDSSWIQVYIITIMLIHSLSPALMAVWFLPVQPISNNILHSGPKYISHWCTAYIIVVTVSAIAVVVVVIANTTEQSPSWEAKRSSASQIHHILWNLKIHYCIYNSLPPVHIMNQVNPVHAPSTHFFNPLNANLNPISHLLALVGAHHILHVSRVRVKIHFNIILLATPRFPKWPFSLRISPPKPIRTSPLPPYVLYAQSI